MPVVHNFHSPEPAVPGKVDSVEWNKNHVVNIVNADVDAGAAIAESKLALPFPSHAAATIGAPANGLSILGQVVSLGLASSGVTGALSGTDWDTFNNKQAALTIPLPSAQGGTGLNNGAFTLTIPASGTAALLAISNVFTAKQVVKLPSLGAFINFDVSAFDPNDKGWNINLANFVNAGSARKNVAMNWGYNVSAGGGSVDLSDHSFYMQFESFYKPAGTSIAEWHLNFFAAGNAFSRRPFHLTVDTVTGNVEWNLYFDQATFMRSDGVTQTMIVANGVVVLPSPGTYLRFDVNNVPIIRQFNAAGDFWAPILMLNASNEVEVGTNNYPTRVKDNLYIDKFLAHQGLRVGFYNTAPIVRPAVGGAASVFAANTSGIVDDSATFDGYTIGQVVKALRNLGLLT